MINNKCKILFIYNNFKCCHSQFVWISTPMVWRIPFALLGESDVCRSLRWVWFAYNNINNPITFLLCSCITTLAFDTAILKIFQIFHIKMMWTNINRIGSVKRLFRSTGSNLDGVADITLQIFVYVHTFCKTYKQNRLVSKI